MLKKGKLSKALQEFITELNQSEQTDRDKSIKSFCDEQENLVYEAIKSLTITIPSGTITVVTNTGTGTNAAPIILNNIIS